ncbi:hypothetical protein [Wolbachia endosymbiont (group E) of Neria commutata]|uniref:hypothetical protein n=1 Tax=Wolbachia endosymbiont (group E) of Neria commutata TaxID=3066149 RepID=UPI003132F89A
MGLSYFPALPILAAGAIIAVIPAILFCAYMVYDNYLNDEFNKDDIIMSLILSSVSAAIGVGLAAVANSFFPGVMLEACSAAGLGAAIGAIAPVAAFAGLCAIELIVEKVSEWVESPKIESATPSNGIKKETAAAPLPMK